ncbi:hypothetical protein GCM10009017_15580 [Halarchaeum rubridurum]|uniref:Uncharacterized protein n=1 Tax=Halarchaeum rubridurum TaxID=489911 RepID=A0A830FVW3_9EURY|nr:hypothetical protein GCM10009017_15580 [Halarchaeum rubridurum]
MSSTPRTLTRPRGDTYDSAATPTIPSAHDTATESTGRQNTSSQSDTGKPAEPALRTDVVTDSLCERLTDTATELEATLDGTVPENLEDAVAGWRGLHGLDTNTVSGYLPRLARHAVLSMFLKAVVYEREHRAGNPPTADDADPGGIPDGGP